MRENMLDLSAVLPDAKSEMWRLFSLGSLREQSLKLVDVASATATVAKPTWAAEAVCVVCVDGQFIDISALEVLDGITVERLDVEASQSLRRRRTIKSANAGNQDMPSGSGLRIVVQKTLQQPLVIVHVHRTEGASISPTLEVKLAAGVQATIIETLQTEISTDVASLAAPFTALSLADKAIANYYRWQHVDATLTLLGTLYAELESDATLQGGCYTTAGKLVRLDAEVEILGERSHAQLDGLSLVDSDEQIGLVYRINHPQPNNTSNQNIRVVVEGKGKHLYDGYIYVGHGANGTGAEQDSKAMLLSPMGQALANPRLEIHTDDVSCAHGATIGFLDDDAMFYLSSRGIPEAQAKAMLVEGFTHTALEAIDYEPLHAALVETVHNRFFKTESNHEL